MNLFFFSQKMEQTGIPSEIFYEILLQTDSFIQMRDLIMQLSPSHYIPNDILKKLAQKFNIWYNGNGKSDFIEKIRGMTNLANKMSTLCRSDKYNVVIATINDLPKWYFGYKLIKIGLRFGPYMMFYTDNFDYLKALINRGKILKTTEFIQYFISTAHNYNENFKELLRYLINNDLACSVTYYVETHKKSIQKINDEDVNEIIKQANKICPFYEGMNP